MKISKEENKSFHLHFLNNYYIFCHMWVIWHEVVQCHMRGAISSLWAPEGKVISTLVKTGFLQHWKHRKIFLANFREKCNGLGQRFSTYKFCNHDIMCFLFCENGWYIFWAYKIHSSYICNKTFRQHKNT